MKIHEDAVYCIPELHREQINSGVSVIANPGCYPTSIALSLMPALKNKLVNLILKPVK